MCQLPKAINKDLVRLVERADNYLNKDDDNLRVVLELIISVVLDSL